ncbi:MAG: hypothetical protein II951_01275 [Bacteroidales bacterium]|nr:hypothetical protein [Bacteroidales bacterium]
MRRGEKIGYIVVLIASLTSLIGGCGYKGEPMPEFKPGQAKDTVYNDLTYTAVTGNVSSVSGVAVTLNGFANTNDEIANAFSEQGFLISRYEENMSLKMSEDSAMNSRHAVIRIRVEQENVDPESHLMQTRYYGLIPSTKFYYRAYVVKKDGTEIHGVVKTFTTIEMGISISPNPDEISLMDAYISAVPIGYGPNDYGRTSRIHFLCQDTPIDSTGYTPTYSRYQEAETGAAEGRYYSRFHDLIPGGQYYAKAYIEVESPFFVYEEDNVVNPLTGQYTYGTEAIDVSRKRYKTAEMQIKATELTGVGVFTSEEYEQSYDVIDIKDNYFVMPSDTITIAEYGVALVTTDPSDSTKYLYEYHEADDVALRTGNRYDVRIVGLELKHDYRYVAYLVVRGLYFYSVDIKEFSTKDYTPKEIDMGGKLIWADRNIGAWAPEVYGEYYAWGEVEPKRNYNEGNFEGTPLEYTGSIAGAEYDVATVKWGNGWRMPTREEIKELCDECEWSYTRLEGVPGFRVVSPNDNELFLPFGGSMVDAKHVGYKTDGKYWTADRYTEHKSETDVGYANYLYFLEGSHIPPEHANEDYPFLHGKASVGMLIRPVKSK